MANRLDTEGTDAAVPTVARSRLVRAFSIILGFVFLGVGIAGWIVPGIPGTINLLIALWFFSMSSERMHRWMLTNKYFGQELSDYKSGLGIPRRVKIIAITSIVLAVSYSAGFAISNLWMRLSLVALGLYGIWFIVTRPTREIELARRATARRAAA